MRERNRNFVLGACGREYTPVAEIMLRTGLSYYTVLRHLKDLRAEGKVSAAEEREDFWRKEDGVTP